MRNPEKFEELSSVDVPILGIMREKDDIAINSLEGDLELIKSKAINCPEFTTRFIPKASHTYDKQERSFAEVVLEWVKELSKN